MPYGPSTFRLSEGPAQRGGSILNTSQSADSVRPQVATVPPGISMSPDRQGSGATRIEADPSIKRGEKN